MIVARQQRQKPHVRMGPKIGAIPYIQYVLHIFLIRDANLAFCIVRNTINFSILPCYNAGQNTKIDSIRRKFKYEILSRRKIFLLVI